MSPESIAWNGYMASRGQRFRLDFVLIDPPSEFLPPVGSGFPGDLIEAVVGNWPGVAVERVERLTKQVVSVDIIITRAGDLGQRISEFVVVPAPTTTGIFGGIKGVRDLLTGDTDRTLMLSGVWYEGTPRATASDIEKAEESDADAFRDPAIVEAAGRVRDALGDVAGLAPTFIRLLPFAVVGVGLFLVLRR